MASNYSNKSKTLKEMFQVLPSDIWSIDRLQKYCDYQNLSQICECWLLDDYREYFDQFLEEVDLSEDFYYSPAAFAEYYYGTPDLDFIVMYFAKIPTLFEFNKPKIKVLSLSKLKDLNKLIVYVKDEVDESRENPTPYLYFNEITDVKEVIRTVNSTVTVEQQDVLSTNISRTNKSSYKRNTSSATNTFLAAETSTANTGSSSVNKNVLSAKKALVTNDPLKKKEIARFDTTTKTASTSTPSKLITQIKQDKAAQKRNISLMNSQNRF